MERWREGLLDYMRPSYGSLPPEKTPIPNKKAWAPPQKKTQEKKGKGLNAPSKNEKKIQKATSQNRLQKKMAKNHKKRAKKRKKKRKKRRKKKRKRNKSS